MKTLIFDGSPEGDPMGQRLADHFENLLRQQGHEAERIILREQRIAPCSGCFRCWLNTPGLCTINDDGRELTGKFVKADLIVSLTPILFGVYGPELKRMYDRLIPNVSPFFMTVEGETHHRKRYEKYPDVITIGWLDRPDQSAEKLFRHLVYRNNVNFNSIASAVEILYRNDIDQVVDDKLQSLLTSIARHERISEASLPDLPLSGMSRVQVRRAVLLVGSPRMSHSSSSALGGYLFDRLREQGIETESVMLYPAFHDDKRRQRLMELIEGSDLTVLAFPLYVDSLPFPVLDLLRDIARRRQEKPPTGALAAIVNCGFIESSQNDNVLAACRLFARDAGLAWQGALSIGGGEGLVRGISLHEQQGAVIPLKLALDRVAEELGAGRPVPDDARLRIAKPFVPPWIYRMVSSIGWKRQARRLGTIRRLDDRPYLDERSIQEVS